MDPSNRILEIVQKKGTFSEDDCIQAINFIVDLLKQYLRTLTADSIGSIPFSDFSEGYRHWFPLNFWFGRERKILGKQIQDILDTRGFFFSRLDKDFLKPIKGRTKALIYGIDRNGKWIGVVVDFDRETSSEGVHFLARGFDVKNKNELFIEGPQELVCNSTRLKGLLISYDQIRLDLLQIAEKAFARREEQYREAQTLLEQMKGCSVLAGHIISSVAK